MNRNENMSCILADNALWCFQMSSSSTPTVVAGLGYMLVPFTVQLVSNHSKADKRIQYSLRMTQPLDTLRVWCSNV